MRLTFWALLLLGCSGAWRSPTMGYGVHFAPGTVRPAVYEHDEGDLRISLADASGGEPRLSVIAVRSKRGAAFEADEVHATALREELARSVLASLPQCELLPRPPPVGGWAEDTFTCTGHQTVRVRSHVEPSGLYAQLAAYADDEDFARRFAERFFASFEPPQAPDASVTIDAGVPALDLGPWQPL
jgi:hypothetical protein